MPPRSFTHWYRGASVEALSRASTSSPWGVRGALTTPVIRVDSDQPAATGGGLGAGGSGAIGTRSPEYARARLTTSGQARDSAALLAFPLGRVTMAAAADARSSFDIPPSGGCSPSVHARVTTSVDFACEGGIEAVISAEVQRGVEPEAGGAWSVTGRALAASSFVEVLEGGAQPHTSVNVAQESRHTGSGGSPIGGVGAALVIPPGRSFRFWMRGEPLGAATSRRGDFAHGYRGWLGVSSAGKVGGAASMGAPWRMRLGGSAPEAGRVEHHPVSAASVAYGGLADLAQDVLVKDTAGTVGLGGTAEVGQGISCWAVGVATVGGEGSARSDASFVATALVGASALALPSIEVDVDASWAKSFGATAQVGVDHGAGRFIARPAAFGGVAANVAASTMTARGGLAIGGASSMLGLGTVYRIYSNGGDGGPIDYRAPIAEVSELQWTSDALPAGSSFRFGVRAYDPINGLLDENLDASVTLVLDAVGRDATGVPPAPIGLRAIDLGGGRARLEWTAVESSTRPATHYHVYIGQDSFSDFSSPIVVPVAPRGRAVATEIRDLLEGRRYVATVRAANAHGEDGNTSTILFTVDRSPPAVVDHLSACVSASTA